MRQLLCRRDRIGHGPGLSGSSWLATCAGAVALCCAALAADTPALSVRITSPLGRTGVPGSIRIVAQVRAASGAAPQAVRFYIDGALLKADDDGPPYAVEWVDENPFERRELAVEVEDHLGHAARDTVLLEPFEIVEVSHVISVLLDVAVYDRKGRFVTGLAPSIFSLQEDGVAQQLDLIRQEAVPGTFALLVDSSQSMARRFEVVQRIAARFARYLRSEDRILVVPFSHELGPITGPTRDLDTVMEAIATVRPRGGTAILDSLVAASKHFSGDESRRVVVVITDGYDENSLSTFDEALTRLKAARATVYIVGVGGVAGISLQGERLLRRLAAETGGTAFFPPSDQALTAAYDALTADAQHRYVISYTSTNQELDGRWRAVSLTTGSPDHVIRTRPGYFAPKPPPIRPALEFTVTDAHQRYADLSADDLVVVEDGVAQRVESFHEAVAPVSIVLALDASGSMRRSAPAVMEAARSFVEALRPEDALGLILFADQPVFAHDLATNRKDSLDAINTYQALGGTALYDAVADSLARLKRVEGRRVVVVMTDGRDENNPGTGPGSVRTFDEVSGQVRETGATLFAIGLGTNVARAQLERLAHLSGGQAYFPADISGLGDEFRRVVETLRRRFVVSYTSTNFNRDGKWRNVAIQPRASSLVVSSAGGYFAPER